MATKKPTKAQIAKMVEAQAAGETPAVEVEKAEGEQAQLDQRVSKTQRMFF